MRWTNLLSSIILYYHMPQMSPYLSWQIDTDRTSRAYCRHFHKMGAMSDSVIKASILLEGKCMTTTAISLHTILSFFFFLLLDNIKQKPELKLIFIFLTMFMESIGISKLKIMLKPVLKKAELKHRSCVMLKTAFIGQSH